MCCVGRRFRTREPSGSQFCRTTSTLVWGLIPNFSTQNLGAGPEFPVFLVFLPAIGCVVLPYSEGLICVARCTPRTRSRCINWHLAFDIFFTLCSKLLFSTAFVSTSFRIPVLLQTQNEGFDIACGGVCIAGRCQPSSGARAAEDTCSTLAMLVQAADLPDGAHCGMFPPSLGRIWCVANTWNRSADARTQRRRRATNPI